MASGSAGQFTPSCTVIVPTRNHPDLLNRCLQAVAGLKYPDFGVLVVDNAPSNDEARVVASRWGARYIVEPKLGVSRARNVGLRNCKTEIAAFLDDDTCPHGDWLSAIVDEFRDPQVMGVTGRIHYCDSESRFQFQQPHSDEHLRLDRQSQSWFKLSNFGDVGGANNMAFRSGSLQDWPGFDERLGHGSFVQGCADRHVLFSLIKRGYRVVYTPHAIVTHPAPESALAIRKRFILDRSAVSGYLTMLLVEEPEFRDEVIKFVLEKVRVLTVHQRERIVPLWREVLACLSGPFLYTCALLSQGSRRL